MKPDELRAWVLARLYLKEYTTARPVAMDDLQTGVENGDREAIPAAVDELHDRGWVVRSKDAAGIVIANVGASLPWAWPHLTPNRQAAIRSKAPPWLRDALPAPPSPTLVPSVDGSAASAEPSLDEPVTRREVLVLLKGHATIEGFERLRLAIQQVLERERQVEPRPDDLHDTMRDLHARLDALAGQVGTLKSRLTDSGPQDVAHLEQQVGALATRVATFDAQLEKAFRWSREAAIESGLMVRDYYPALLTMVTSTQAPPDIREKVIETGWPRCSWVSGPGSPRCGLRAVTCYPAFRPTPEGGAYSFTGFQFACSGEHGVECGIIHDNPLVARRLGKEGRLPMDAKSFTLTGAAGEVFLRALGKRVKPDHNGK